MSEAKKWPSVERKYLKDEIKWFEAGGKLISPTPRSPPSKPWWAGKQYLPAQRRDRRG